MHITTDFSIYQKAFEQYLRKGTPIDLSLKMMTARTETRDNHSTALYRWRTAGDGKVRPSHVANEGRIFNWDVAPATGHPGEEFGCCCVAEPVEIDASPLELLALLSGVGIVRTVGVRVGAAILRRIERSRDTPAQPNPAPKPTRSIQESPINILKPNGQPIGRQGKRPEVRIIKGDKDAANKLFEELTKGGTNEKRVGYPGTGKRLPNGDWIGYREVSKSGSPTIDLDVKGLNFDKIHFFE